jgi:hypothetical protein
MLQISPEQKQFLLYLITNCEIYQLNEKEALEYIKNKFLKPISRRSYYNYKSKMYKEHDKIAPFFELFRFHESKQRSKDMASLSLISHRECIIRDGLINRNFTSRNEFSRLDDPELSLKKIREKTGSLITESEKVLVKINSKIQKSSRNFEFIPKKATIRKEYIKCGKYLCLGCNHGPYYYAYWRDENGKLKKKYIGKRDPREETDDNDLETIFSKKENNLEDIFDSSNNLESKLNNQGKFRQNI